MPTHVVRIDANLQWKSLRGRGGNWVAVCDPLRITLQAETWGDLMEEISNALDALMQDLLSSNELDQFMKEQGWTVQGQMPVGKPRQNIRFDVPFFLAMQGANDTQRHVRQ
jgi:hypothetical protein